MLFRSDEGTLFVMTTDFSKNLCKFMTSSKVPPKDIVWSALLVLCSQSTEPAPCAGVAMRQLFCTGTRCCWW